MCSAGHLTNNISPASAAAAVGVGCGVRLAGVHCNSQPTLRVGEQPMEPPPTAAHVWHCTDDDFITVYTHPLMFPSPLAGDESCSEKQTLNLSKKQLKKVPKQDDAQNIRKLILDENELQKIDNIDSYLKIETVPIYSPY